MIKKENVTNEIIKKLGKDYECPICCENFNINDFIIITECKHFFHYKCIKQAIEKNILNCPICRRSIKNIEINDNINNFNNIYNFIRNNHNYNNLREIDNNQNFIIKILKLPIIIVEEIINFIISIIKGIINLIVQILMLPIYIVNGIINLVIQILMLPIYIIKGIINLIKTIINN